MFCCIMVLKRHVHTQGHLGPHPVKEYVLQKYFLKVRFDLIVKTIMKRQYSKARSQERRC